MMTPQQIQTVKDSWRLIEPQPLEVAGLFYKRLFELDPALRPLFSGDLQAQGLKLMAALQQVVGALGHLDTVLPAVQQLARRHVGYGVQAAHYDTVGDALAWTLAQGLGAAATPELLQAWREAYDTLAGAMKAAAWPQRPVAGEWQAQTL
jgi:hemoglobin-like flavoprotein